MKVVFLSGSRSSAAGGIFEVERSVANKLHDRYGLSVDAAGVLDEGTERDQGAWSKTNVYCFPAKGPKRFGYSPGLRDWLRNSQHDVLHLHNLWMYMSVLALDWHQRTHRPFIVSPHGMLDPWAIKNSGWRKRFAALLYERRMLKKAAVIHAFHEKDLDDIRSFGLTNPVAIIPNGVELSNLPPQTSNTKQRQILYLGRLHPKKGLSELIEAWGRIPIERRSGWKIKIAGWDDGGHLASLTQETNHRGLQETIQFVGPAFGDDKSRLFQESSGFILPSKSEGLPMTVLEAWAFSLPVIMTKECNLPAGFAASAALKIEPTPAEIVRGVLEFIDLSDEERRQIGERGRRLVEQQFSWDTVTDQFMEVYRWMDGSGPKPSCIHTITQK